jgi:hypothetical protein
MFDVSILFLFGVLEHLTEKVDGGIFVKDVNVFIITNTG